VTDLSDKKVARFTQEEYEEFWKQHMTEQVKYICDLCSKPIRKRNFIDHMEKNHKNLYDKHDRKIERDTE